MMRQKLLIGRNLEQLKEKELEIESEEAMKVEGLPALEPQNTESPQCEHIVVEAVQTWGGADVTAEQLRGTIDEINAQMTSVSSANSAEEKADFERMCESLRKELVDLETGRKRVQESELPEF